MCVSWLLLTNGCRVCTNTPLAIDRLLTDQSRCRSRCSNTCFHCCYGSQMVEVTAEIITIRIRYNLHLYRINITLDLRGDWLLCGALSLAAGHSSQAVFELHPLSCTRLSPPSVIPSGRSQTLRWRPPASHSFSAVLDFWIFFVEFVLVGTAHHSQRNAVLLIH